MASQGEGASAVAIIGAVTGITALGWNIWRSVRAGARLHVSFYVYQEDDERTPRHGPVAAIDVANVGTLPAYVSSVALTMTGKLHWSRRLPLVRSVTFRARHRWWLHWMLGRPRLWLWDVPMNPDLLGRLEPGEVKRGLLAAIMNGKPEPMADDRIEGLLAQREWVVVETGLRQYIARIGDNRT